MTPYASFASTIAFITTVDSASAETIAFGGAQPGTLPKEFVSALTGDGSAGRWEVVEDASVDRNQDWPN